MTLTAGRYQAAIDVPRLLWDPTEGSHPRHGERPFSAISGVEVHWTGTPGDIADHGDTDTELLSFERFHEASKGWSDLFYNVGLDTDGFTYEGRDITVRSQSNLGSWLTLLVVVGPDDVLTAAEIDAVTRGIWRVWSAVDPTLNPASIRTHRRRPASTSCPGDQLDDIVAGIHEFRNQPTEADPMNPDAQKAVDAGFWNGTRETEPATREEVGIMVWRAYEKLVNVIAQNQSTINALNTEATSVQQELLTHSQALSGVRNDVNALTTVVEDGTATQTQTEPLRVQIVGIG